MNDTSQSLDPSCRVRCRVLRVDSQSPGPPPGESLSERVQVSASETSALYRVVSSRQCRGRFFAKRCSQRSRHFRRRAINVRWVARNLREVQPVLWRSFGNRDPIPVMPNTLQTTHGLAGSLLLMLLVSTSSDRERTLHKKQRGTRKWLDVLLRRPPSRIAHRALHFSGTDVLACQLICSGQTGMSVLPVMP